MRLCAGWTEVRHEQGVLPPAAIIAIRQAHLASCTLGIHSGWLGPPGDKVFIQAGQHVRWRAGGLKAEAGSGCKKIRL